ncbi:hypothetical protein LEMLEM_LOCUS6498 [Lemmus lemmus]
MFIIQTPFIPPVFQCLQRCNSNIEGRPQMTDKLWTYAPNPGVWKRDVAGGKVQW